ncbi:MAG TPA: serine hydrolase domain-containing protein, partial [Gemmatimonadaceae bacterium]|nr:serine hydrolase domain-containing protein [Gemmatimonadaceae bacterium]
MPASRRSALLLAVALVAPAALTGQTLRAPDARRIDVLFADQNKPHVPGCALGVMRNGTLAYGRGYGWADLERNVPITTATLFDIGSTSKQFAAASISLLVAEHKLSYADDVRKYIPELPEYGAPITIDNLMRHTSGLRDYTGLLVLAGHTLEEATTDSQALARIVRQRHLNFPTGSKYEYSNTGYFLLSVIIQRVTGKPLADFARERIFLPLGMTHTRYRNHAAMLIPNRALGYAPDDSGGFRNSMSNWEQTGDGAVQLSIDDALKWDENYYHPRVGGAQMVREMQTRGTLANGDSISYARGLFIGHYRGLRRVRHGGDWVGYHAAYSRFPDQHTSVMILCNSDGIAPSDLADKVSDIVLAKSFTEKAASIAAAGEEKVAPGVSAKALDASRLTGSYYASSNDEVVRIVKRDTALVLEFVGRSLPLHLIAPATYAVSGLPVTVEFVADGNAPAHAVRLRVASELRAEAERFTATTPDEAALRQFAGSYYSPELGVTWPMAVDGDHLVLRNEGSELVDISGALSPAMKDAFTAGGG